MAWLHFHYFLCYLKKLVGNNQLNEMAEMKHNEQGHLENEMTGIESL
jgi:hypothetical protein